MPQTQPRLPNDLLDIIFTYAINTPLEVFYAARRPAHIQPYLTIDSVAKLISPARTNMASRIIALRTLKARIQEEKQDYQRHMISHRMHWCGEYAAALEENDGTLIQSRRRIDALKGAARQVMRR